MDDHELDQRIRSQRPRAGWASSPAGVAVLERVKRGEAPARRRWTTGRTLAVAASVAVVAAAGVMGVRQLTSSSDQVAVRPANGTTVPIQGGYTYDVSKLATVLANTDTVVGAEVLAITDRDESGGWTTYRVRVMRSVKGSAPAEILVRQHGYVDRGGTTHIIEGQALVEVGKLYMFATNREADGAGSIYTVAPGPHAARPAATETELTSVAAQYAAAAGR